MRYTEQQREQISEAAKGKVIASFEFEEDGDYWILEFEDGSEMSVRLMAELV